MVINIVTKTVTTFTHLKNSEITSETLESKTVKRESRAEFQHSFL